MSQAFGQHIVESLFKPDTWAGMAGDTLNSYFESIGALSKRIASGTPLTAAEIEFVRGRMQTIADAMYRMGNAVDASQTVDATDSKVKAFFKSLSISTQAQMRQLNIAALYAQQFPTAANLEAVASYAKPLTRAFGIFVGAGQVVAAGMNGGVGDAAIKGVSVLAGTLAASAAAGVVTAAAAAAVFTAPAWIVVGTVVGAAALAGWAVGEGTEYGLTKLIELADQWALPQVRLQIAQAQAALGGLDGSWMEGMTLSTEQKTALTKLLIATGKVDITAAASADISKVCTAFASGRTVDRDAVVRAILDINRELNGYTSELATVDADRLTLAVPPQAQATRIGLGDYVSKSVLPIEQPFVGVVLPNSLTVAVTAGTHVGTAGDDLIVGTPGADTLLGDAGGDVLVGTGGVDVLDGGASYDTLFGGDGDDKLTGGDGSDWLLGGNGDDEYYFSNGSGDDLIVDADGVGKLFFVNSPAVQLTGGKKVPGVDNSWISDEISGVRYGLSLMANGSGGTDLVVTKGSSLDRITIRNWQPGQLGITLDGAVATLPPPTGTLTGDFVKAVDPNDPTKYLFDALGNYVADGAQPDAADLITGATAAELIQGLGGDDALLGRAGDDVVDGGAGNDVLMGGLGADRIIGGDGNDIIYGSSNGTLIYPTNTDFIPPTQTHPILLGRGFNWVHDGDTPAVPGDNPRASYLTTTVDRDTQPNDQGNLIDGGAGLDKIVAGTGPDLVRGGDDGDELIGLDGGDALFGDGGNDRVYGDGWPNVLTYTPPEREGNDLIDGGAGNDILVGGGADDEIYGGIDADQLYGDSGDVTTTSATVHGHDYLDGGDGADTLVGGGRSDDLFGGSGDDQLWGDAGAVAVTDPHYIDSSYQGDDYLDGEDGNDYLQGEGGADTLFGGAGNDLLSGDDDEARLPGAVQGADYLDGEDGDDLL